MINHTSGYNSELDKTTYEEHFNYVFIDSNSNEHLINNKSGIDILNTNVEITGIEYQINSSGTYNGLEIKLIGKIIKKQTSITLINLTKYIDIKKINNTSGKKGTIVWNLV